MSAGGNYTPTLTGVLNIQALTLRRAVWRQVDNWVEVWFVVTVDPTAGSAWSFRISLPPVGRVQLTADADVMGICAAANSAGFGGTVRGVVATQDALADGSHGIATPLDVYGHFAFRLP